MKINFRTIVTPITLALAVYIAIVEMFRCISSITIFNFTINRYSQPFEDYACLFLAVFVFAVFSFIRHIYNKFIQTKHQNCRKNTLFFYRIT